ncbi:MAG: Entericidin EcnA/B family protein [Erythrobacter sp.]
MDRKPVKSLLVLALLLAVSACNTVQGLGEDISSVGRKGEEVIN